MSAGDSMQGQAPYAAPQSVPGPQVSGAKAQQMTQTESKRFGDNILLFPPIA